MTDSSASTPEAGVEFAAVDAPVASVIILAWHLTDGLLDCLRAIRDSTGAPDYEVVIVLNGADPAVRRLVADDVRGATIVDHEANIGYGAGCNSGARVARGRYLLLVNDDAVVEPDWMRTIVAAAEADERVGALGSLLFNSDGTVQEAGSRVLPAPASLQLGAGMTEAEAEAAGLLTSREINYGGGAALLLRRTAFDAMDGFDRRYEPAYWEDVDLCFRLRRAGWSVRLEPAARGTHVSGGSTSGDRRFRTYALEHAAQRFKERWGPTLAAAPGPDAPVTAICDPSLSDVHDAPEGLSLTESPTTIALRVAAGYRDWLLDQLDRTDEELAEQRDTVRRLADRLDQLERTGLFGIARWRLGLLRRRIRSRISDGRR